MKSRIASMLACAVLLGACASREAPVTSSTQGTTLVQTGQVTEVRDVVRQGGRGSGIGSFLGAILGGVAGSNIGSGTGSTVASIGGAVAGSMAGQRAEESSIRSGSTAVTVRLESGEVRSFQLEPGENYRVGDVVRVTTANGISRLSPAHTISR
ncbi:outer membrane lipoprotein [Noviherbaspirillum aridicola]|uniref:Lipoprotein n=1 Tax=Noviherbaspirillum aridicola TaxID=2849687 RepID=A0ABQ4Q1I9_9BURK|nr:glycine zipper 2TM domain-containing protein [Noviherbaspirillum aridicola]GIZ50984.1 lipoprotein [Noviherbaspirillum aridicola]